MSQIQLHRIDLNLLATFEALMEEGSVAAAADRLALTPSAVSHALGRLRTQFDDPLLVRVGGKMQPTPQALLLANELAPVLRGLRRALETPEPFDPATSDRVFRIALHSSPAFMARVTAAIQASGAERDAGLGPDQAEQPERPGGRADRPPCTSAVPPIWSTGSRRSISRR